MGVQYKDYYQILGVSKTATEKEIKSAFRKLARQHHPDMSTGSEAKFKELNEAYEVLSDPEKRRRYDSLGSDWRHGRPFEPPPGSAGFGNAGFSGSGDFSDFFESIFGGMGGMGGGRTSSSSAGGGGDPFDMFQQFSTGGGRSRATGRQSASASSQDLNIEVSLALSLDDLVRPTKRSVVLPTKKTVTVTIPKGTVPGSKIKLKGQGHQAGHQVGDVYLTVVLKPHPQYQVDGLNLIVDLKLPFPDLVLGTTREVPSLEGSVKLTIPAGTEPGKKLRLKGKGLPGKTASENGDLLVKIGVVMPSELTDDVRRHYQALKDIE